MNDNTLETLHYDYRGHSCRVEQNKSTGWVYGYVEALVDTVAGPRVKHQYSFRAPSLEAAEGAFHTSVDNYILGRTPQSTHGYELHYTINGLAYPVEGTIILPTAKDVLLLYVLPSSTVTTLEAIINGVNGLDISVHMDVLWDTLPDWLRASITTIEQVIMYLNPSNAPDNYYPGEHEALINDLLSSINVEAPRQPLQALINGGE